MSYERTVQTGDWYEWHGLFIEVGERTRPDSDWRKIRCVTLRDGHGPLSRDFLHEYEKSEQHFPDGYPAQPDWYLLPDGPPERIRTALSWPEDPHGRYRVAPAARKP